jgi:predicted deacetylase
MNWPVWDSIETMLRELAVRPVLAVIPENADDVLRVCSPVADFWDRIREWQDLGWTIGMHGWQHRFVTKNGGILGLNQFSEFAGLSRSEQKEKLNRARDIFAKERIQSDLFIAPAHSFDRTTLELLRELGFRYISDGFFPTPITDELGITWVPQQLWRYRWRPFGTWTICFHMNSWTSSDVRGFRQSTARYEESISDFRNVIQQHVSRPPSVLDVAVASVYQVAAELGSSAKNKTKHLIAFSSAKT